MKTNNPYNSKIGVRGMVKEMFRDDPDKYLTPEQVDEQIFDEQSEEQKQQEEDERIVDRIEVGSEREQQEMLDAKQTLVNLQVGCIALSFLLQLGCFFVPVWWLYAVGNLVGCVLAFLCITWIYKTIEKVMDLDPGSAWKVARNHAMLRYLTIFLVLVLVCLIGDKWMALGAILSTLTMKFSAYVQGVTGHILAKLRKGR